MEGLEATAFQIISASGAAKSSYIEAIKRAELGDIKEAKALIQSGAEDFLEGHAAHSKLLEKSAQGEEVLSLLIVHAEDQMMAAESFRTVAESFIRMYEKFSQQTSEK